MCGWGRYRGWCVPETDEQYAQRLEAQDRRLAMQGAAATRFSQRRRAAAARRLAAVPAQPFHCVRAQRAKGEDGEVDVTCCVCLGDMEPDDAVKQLPCHHWYTSVSRHIECARACRACALFHTPPSMHRQPLLIVRVCFFFPVCNSSSSFHADCIDEWHRRSSLCPLCKVKPLHVPAGARVHAPHVFACRLYALCLGFSHA